MHEVAVDHQYFRRRAQHLGTRQFDRQVLRHPVAAVKGCHGAAFELPHHQPGFPVAAAEVIKAGTRERYLLALTVQRQQQIVDMHPAFPAMIILHLEPLGFAHQQRQPLPLFTDPDHRIGGRRPCVPLNKGFRYLHLWLRLVIPPPAIC